MTTEEERIEGKVLEILTNSNLDEMTKFKVRKLASEQLGLDLNIPNRKKFVSKVVDTYLSTYPTKEEEEDQEEKVKEYDVLGNHIICQLSSNRKVILSNYKGKKLVSIREYYNKNGEDHPSTKGISLTAEQWAIFKQNVPAIENAVNKLASRLNE